MSLRRRDLLFVVSFLFIFVVGQVFSQQVLTLQDSISIALKNNLSIRSAEMKVKSAEDKVREARSSMLPNISGSISYIYTGKLQEMELDLSGMFAGMPTTPSKGAPPTGDNPIQIGMPSRTSFPIGSKHVSRAGISAQQAIFTWGKILNAYEQAKLALEAERCALESTKQQVILDTTKAFYNVLLTNELVKVSEMAVAQVQAHLKTTQDLIDVGMATNFDLLRAKVQLANVSSQLIKMRNLKKLSEDALKNTLGLDLNTPIELKGQLVYKSLDLNLDELFKLALANRPELKQLDLQERAAKKIVSVAKAGNKPNLFAVYDYSYMANEKEFDDIFKDENWKNTWSLTFALSIPIFDGLATRAKVKQAESAVKQVQIAKQQLINGIALEVRSAFFSFQEAKELLKAQEETVQQAQESLRIANLRYKNGMITNVELMDTELALTQAQTNYSNALSDYMIAIARLEKATATKLLE